MTAALGSNPSYVWRSLIWSHDLLKKGLYWRVGNGLDILAKSDPWIPGLPSYKSHYNQILDGNTNVNHFISGEGNWKEEDVRRVFSPYEAEAILNIPLIRKGFKDLRFWTENKNGKYSVKSGYLLETKGWETPAYQSAQPDLAW